jgi:hypothetical protein
MLNNYIELLSLPHFLLRFRFLLLLLLPLPSILLTGSNKTDERYMMPRT